MICNHEVLGWCSAQRPCAGHWVTAVIYGVSSYIMNDLICFDSLSLKVNVRHASISCADCCHKKSRIRTTTLTPAILRAGVPPPSFQSNSDRISTCLGVCFSPPFTHRAPFLSASSWLTRRWSAANCGSTKGAHQSSTGNEPRPVFLDQSFAILVHLIHCVHRSKNKTKQNCTGK